MASAQAYDSWEDAGMVFSTDQLEEYLPSEWAQERVAKLCAMRQVVMRHLELPDIAKPMWWQKVSKVLRDRIMWYCKALHLEGPTPKELGDEGLPGRNTAAGKELSRIASLLDVKEWLADWGTDTEASLRYVVTIGRRAAASCKWDKSTKKASNRLANCVMDEIRAAQYLDKELSAYRMT
jgi:hypothetical protein